jgi:hypothetical protein
MSYCNLNPHHKRAFLKTWLTQIYVNLHHFSKLKHLVLGILKVDVSQRRAAERSQFFSSLAEVSTLSLSKCAHRPRAI